MEKRDDLFYIDEVRRGNLSAFSYLVETYQGLVYSMALNLLKNAEDAEEVAQDCFVKAYTKLDTFEAKSKFSTWLYSIVYRTCITELRKRKVVVSSLDENRISDAEEYRLFESISGDRMSERKKYIEQALERLPEEDMALINLYYYEDLPVGEIALITGLSESNVKVKIFRARKKVYAELQELLKDEIYSLL